MTPNIAPPQLVKEAQEAHELFCGSWSAIKTNTLELGRAVVWMEEKALYKYVRKEGSRKGYLSLEDYALAQSGGELNHTKLYDAKRIYLLTQGENAIPAETVAQMSKRNQLQLARVPAKKRTKKLVEQARSESVLTFRETAQDVVNEDLAPEKRKHPMVDVVLRGIHARVAREFYQLMDDVKDLAIVKDGDFDINIESKALMAIVTSARSWCQDIINQAKAKAQRESPEIPETVNEAAQTHSDQAEDALETVTYSAPDAGQRIGLAEAEGRVVNRKPEARN